MIDSHSWLWSGHGTSRIQISSEAAADTITEGIGGSFEQYEAALRARTVEQARTQLGDAPFDEAITAGRELILEEAVELALSYAEGAVRRA